MSDDASDQEATTPTQSEFATFQVLANTEFVNLKRNVKPSSPIIELANNEDFGFEQELAEVNVEEELFPPQSFQQENLPQQSKEESEEEEEDSEVEYFQPPQPSKTSSAWQPKNFDQASLASKSSAKSYKSKAKSVESSRSSVKSKISERSFHPPPEKTRRYKETNQAEIDAEKEGLLAELYALERQGTAKLLRPLTMKDSLEEIQFQFDRIQAELNATQMVDFAKSAIKMGSGMLEMVLKRAGIKVVEGYHDNLCKDMNKFNRPLSRMYKKYWRRGGMSPEAELGMLVFGSLAWTVVQNKMGSAAAAFTGAADAPPAPEPVKQAASVSATRMRPHQMSSLNVPSSWTNSNDEDASDFSAQAETMHKESQRKELEKKNAEAAQAADKMMKEAEKKLAQVEQMRKTLEEREKLLDVREESLDSQSLEEEELQPPPTPAPVKVVALNASSKSSARRRSTILNL